MPKGIWIFVEHTAGKIRKISLELLSQGRKIADQTGEPLIAVIAGEGTSPLAQEAAAYGVDQIYLLDSPPLAQYTTGAYTSALTKLIREKEPQALLLGYTAVGKDLAPRLAQRLGAGLASDVIDIEVDPEKFLIYKRPVYTGSAYSFVEIVTRPSLATVRAKSFPVAEPDPSRQAEVIEATVTVDPEDLKVLLQDVALLVTSRPALTEADFVVSGGRGMKAKENFAILEELADVIGGAVGASRAAVDSGWIDNQFQVGQTGSIVAPTLYVACGISGAIQHIAGMGAAKFIVAINKDPEAPIFSVADYGIVGDLFEVVPLLTEEFKKLVSA
ncbi:electron transfer flavoprotein FAD-binding domain protein [Desulfitobacterium hafniense DP7]|uniref:Electron transfer flavoprotein FAD-binding domain protein n=1 Tax=Desulfitobacterium hafniense DP7 TaxID=537010 RepID=G9XHY6_DESHA|nr:electron transfer flavoprotein subunit alpha/FixB family protein [Desulfitobacterium hafniense]EHL08705.1 electron transfer flavoprotein FAD-binding domain protein [Desulfitobacterium hafniense DP7]